MAFPGDRKRKLLRPIKASAIYGSLNYDIVVALSQDDFGDEDITLGGEHAMKNGGADLAVSSDEEGASRLALDVIRCELNATPANSRIELRIRVPNVSDSVDTPLWIWWGSDTESLPAENADYGKFDVYNGTTGVGTPLTTHAFWSFDEELADPAPEFKDRSGNDNHITGYAQNNRVEGATYGVLGRGQRVVTTGQDAGGTAASNITLGTSAFAIASIFAYGSTDPGVNLLCENPWTNITVSYSNGYLLFGDWSINMIPDNAANVVGLAGFARQSNNSSILYSNITTTTGTITDNIPGANVVSVSGEGSMLFFNWILSCAPNSNWFRALYECELNHTNFFDRTTSSTSATLDVEIYFDGLQTDSEVRVFEYPHPQIWTVNFNNKTAVSLLGKNITFQIQGESEPEAHYLWFNNAADGYSDPALSGTGHEIVIETSYTATQIASAVASTLNSDPEISASSTNGTATISSVRSGLLEDPVDGNTTATITIIQCGGSSSEEIDGIEDSVGNYWSMTLSVLRPRRILIHIMHLHYQMKRYTTVVGINGLIVPAGVMQVPDRQYNNPPGGP